MTGQPSLEPAFHPDYAGQHGCAWFALPAEGPREPAKVGGWAALGGELPFAFASWRDLPAGVTWWTNLNKTEAWMLGQWGRFKEGGALGADWLTLMNEWGQGTEAADAGEGARRGSEIFARLGWWLSSWSAQQTPDQPWGWGQGDLADALAQRWGWSEGAPQEPQPIFSAAFTQTIKQEVPSGFWTGRRRVALPLPRLAHVRNLWATRYPVGDWTALQNDWPSVPRQRAHWAKSQTAPLLLRVDAVEWRAGPDEDQGWLWLGLRGRRFPGADREPIWMTGEEVRHLDAWADLSIGAGYRGKGWGGEAVPSGWPLGEEDPLALHAPMPGILGWAAFRAAASPTRDPSRRQKQQVTARALWWRAAERQLCFEAAVRLHRQGVSVVEYGNGQILVVVDPATDSRALAQAVRDAGCMVPAILAPHLPRASALDTTDSVTVGHWLRSFGDPELMCDLDRLVSPWPGPLEQVKTVLTLAAKRLLDLTAQDPDTAWKAAWKDLLNQQARISVARIKRTSRSAS